MSASDASNPPNDAHSVDAYRETFDALQQRHRQTTEILLASLNRDGTV